MPQKPLLRAYERDAQAVQNWLTKEYPAIKEQAKREGNIVFWGDEMGMRSDHLGRSRFRQAGTSYGRRGETPVISGTGHRFRCSMISAITNRGKLAFMVFGQKFKASVFIGFMKRLVRHNRVRKVFFIVDEHPVHVSSKVKKWVEGRKDEIKLFFLPGYSPDLNLDELLNRDVKTNAVGRRRPHNRVEMLRNVRSYLWNTQRRPHKVRVYFQHPKVRYAA
jgi:transposase